MRAAHRVISRFLLQHVKNYQNDSKEFDKLSFPAQLNVMCDRMATAQLKRPQSHESERTKSCPLRPRTLPFEVAYSKQVTLSY